MRMDRELLWLVGGVLGLLVVASVLGWWLARRATAPASKQTIGNLNARTRAWWVMCAVFGLALATGGLGSVILFAVTSFMALREFITLTPTRQGDHRTLFWAFFVVIPLQYYLVATKWYGLFSVLIPVYAFLFVPTRSAIGGDTERFLERTAKIQWGLMVCVYCLSHVPALLMLDIPGFEGQNGKLLFYLVLIVEMSDILQYVFGKTLGRHRIAPTVSPNKTVEGFLGGVMATSIIGAGLWWATPFSPWQSGVLSLLICLMGFAGGLSMSAIKRDRGVKDFGTAISGHGGFLDRVDSLCFAAPVFFHIVRYWFT